MRKTEKYKKIGTLLQKMKEIFADSIDFITNGVVITDPSKKDNPVIYVNKAFEKITGYTSKEAIGKNCRFLQGEDNNQYGLIKLRKAISRKKPIRVILKNYKKDGRRFYNELYISPLEFNKKTYFIGIQNDVTERIVARLKLKRYQQNLEKIIETRTASLIESNKKLLKEIEERKKAQADIIRLNEHLKNYAENIKKQLKGKEKLKPNAKKILTALLSHPEMSLRDISKNTDTPISTISAQRNHLISEGIIRKAYAVNPKAFGLLSIVLFKNANITEYPSEVFFHINAGNGLYMILSKDYGDFEKVQMKIDPFLYDRSIYHFQIKDSDFPRYFEFGAIKPEHLSKFSSVPLLKENDYRVMYGLSRYPELSLAKTAQKIELSVPTISGKKKRLSSVIFPRYVIDFSRLGKFIAIKKSFSEKDFFSVKSQTCISLGLYNDYTDIPGDALEVISVREIQSSGIDFSRLIKKMFLI
jgi:PAS domain S-box-containing protein